MREPTFLVVDDEEIVRDLFHEICSSEGYHLVSAPDCQAGLQAVRDAPVQAVVTDLTLPGMDGFEFLERIAQIDPRIVTVVTTGQGTIDDAVRAMKAGAFDFITKPFQSDAVRAILRKAVDYQRLRQENDLLRRAVRQQYGLDKLIGTSDVVRALLDLPFPASVELNGAGVDLVKELEQYENLLITAALRQANGVTSKAARLLHVNRTTLVEKLKRKKLAARLTVTDRAGSQRVVPGPRAPSPQPGPSTPAGAEPVPLAESACARDA